VYIELTNLNASLLKTRDTGCVDCYLSVV